MALEGKAIVFDPSIADLSSDEKELDEEKRKLNREFIRRISNERRRVRERMMENDKLRRKRKKETTKKEYNKESHNHW